MGIYSSLIIGRDAVIANQRAIEITGHNIANVNTPGYSRQRLMLQAKDPIETGLGMVGTGVTAFGVERIYDCFLGDQINNAAQDLGKWEAQKNVLSRVEIVFDEASGFGLNNAFNEYWNAWQDLANNPGGHTERTILLAKGENLANQFNTMYADLVEVQNDIDAGVSATVDEINILSSQIADLNDKIVSIEATEHSANDYRDERDRLLKELSGLIDFTYTEAGDGRVTVTLGDGTDLVEAPTVANPSGTNTLYATDTTGDGSLNIAWSDPAGANIDADISGGKIRGLLDVRDDSDFIPGYLMKLNDLATSLIADVNAVHAGGYGLDDTVSRGFFAGTDASDISIDPAIVGNVNNIAAAQTASGGAGLSGDNTNALAIANLQGSLTMSGNTANYNDFYSSLVSEVGIDMQQTDQRYDYQSAMAAQLDNYRESISGVSLDEEMVNLIKYQHAYDAAAKLISTIDEMLQTLINMV